MTLNQQKKMITRSRPPDDPDIRTRDKDFKRTITNILKNFKEVVHTWWGKTENLGNFSL